jgi:short-subunit dehydrogenase
MHDLAGRTALVTGASHGLGRYIARALADRSELQRLVTAAHNQLGPVDVLVNNAGVFMPKALHHQDASELEHHVRVNLLAPHSHIVRPPRDARA